MPPGSTSIELQLPKLEAIKARIVDQYGEETFKQAEVTVTKEEKTWEDSLSEIIAEYETGLIPEDDPDLFTVKWQIYQFFAAQANLEARQDRTLETYEDESYQLLAAEARRVNSIIVTANLIVGSNLVD